MIVGKYLEEHPEELHKAAYELVVKAIYGAFPEKSIKAALEYNNSDYSRILNYKSKNK